MDPLRLPYATPALSGVGGLLKEESSHFVVEEIPLYEPSGEGEHLYVRIRREGLNTLDVARRLAAVAGVPAESVGVAGLKDRWARVTQTFSLPRSSFSLDELKSRISGIGDLELLSLEPHPHKLRRGHLKANRFQILVTHLQLPPEEVLPEVRQIAGVLKEKGCPNFYGSQRFGTARENALRGKEIFRGKRSSRGPLASLYLSAYQSYLFNRWLALRMEEGELHRILKGDLARKRSGGGLFPVEDEEEEQLRFDRGEILYTGPIFGKKMRRAEGIPAERERAILEGEGIRESHLRRASPDGSRREALFFPEDLEVELSGASLLFQFTLPPGSYATVLLREFTKNDLSIPRPPWPP